MVRLVNIRFRNICAILRVEVRMDLTLRTALQNYHRNLIAENKTPKTIEGYMDGLKVWVQDIGPDRMVSSLNIADVQEHIISLRTKPGITTGSLMSSHSIAKRYAVIRTFVRWLHVHGWLPSLILDGYQAPKISNELPSPLSPDEVARLFVLLRNHSFRDKVIIEFFLDTGVRLEELAGLTMNRLDLDDGWATVIGKGRKTRRVPLGPILVRDLFEYVSVHRKPKHKDEAIVFLSEHGETHGCAFKYEGVRQMVDRLLTEIRVTGKHGAHTLRHTFATMYLRNGGSLEGLRIILGHTDIKVTQRYIHLLGSDVQNEHLRVSPLESLR